MTLALYRKYRPRTFAEVIGQEHVTEPLSQALRSGRLHHAYLFSGPRGCGKTSSARILARSLNCERGPTPEPCGVCESCRSLAPDGSGSIDVIEIDAASHGGVDDARELRERAFFAPASSRFKIYVIDEAHMVSTQGFNALLKLVEEPPDYVKFIFATTEPDKVLGTIKSRTHHYPFRLIPPGILRPYLEQLAEAEKVKVEQPVFPLVVRAGGGSARDSLSVLDQLIAGAGPEGVSYQRAVALLGVTDAALIDEMCDALAAGDGAVAYATIDRVAEAGHDPRRFASDLLERLRDLIVMQQVPEAAAKGLIDGPADQLERMGAQAQRLGPATLSRCADIVHNGLIEMRGTTAPRLLLELVTARMLLPTADRAESDLLQRLERMERRLAIAGDQGLTPDSDYSGPAVLAGRGPAPTRQPAGDSTEAPAGPQGDAGDEPPAGGGVAAARAAASSAAAVGRAAANGGAAAARAAAAAAAQRASGGPRRTEIVPDDQPAAGDNEPDPAPPAADLPTRGTDGATAGDRGDVAATDNGHDEPPRGVIAAGDEPVAATDNGQDEPPRRVPPQAVMADPATPEPVIPQAAAPGELDAAAVRRVWDEIVTMARVDNKRIAALASEATVRDIDGDTLVLTFRHAFHARTLAENPEPLSDAIYEVLGSRWQIRCELTGDERAGGPGAGPAPARPAGARESTGTSSPAGGRAPGQERGARERSSSARGESGASGDRSSDEDHPAATIAPPRRPDADADAGPGPRRTTAPRMGPTAAIRPPGRRSGRRRPAGRARRKRREPRPAAVVAPARPDTSAGRIDGPAAVVAPARPDTSAGRFDGPPAAKDESRRGPEPRGEHPDQRRVGRQAAASPAPPPVDEEEDWPETALPGGPSGDGDTGPDDAAGSDWPETVAPAAAAPTQAAAVAAPPAPAPPRPAPTATPPPRPAPAGGGAAAAAARAAARAAAGRAQTGADGPAEGGGRRLGGRTTLRPGLRRPRARPVSRVSTPVTSRPTT